MSVSIFSLLLRTCKRLNKVPFVNLSVKRECANGISTKKRTTNNADQKLHNVHQTS